MVVLDEAVSELGMSWSGSTSIRLVAWSFCFVFLLDGASAKTASR